jgi:hypothetical protein
MPENKFDEVFNKRSLTRTVKEVPEPGNDGHALIDGSKSAWNGGIINTKFINNLSGGQEQNLVLSADHVVQVQNSQIVIIQKAQSTTAQQEITITSAENQIYVKAATQIVLEVGKSKITMAADGTIEISGVKVTVKGEVINSNATNQNTITGGMVDINP